MTIEVLIAVLAAIVGAVFGFGADRLARRWPEHEPGHARADLDWRAADWRTLVIVLTGAAVAAGLWLRFGAQPQALVVYGLLFMPLVVLLATDLDQRVLPDELTLPLIGFAAVVLLAGWSPALAGKDLGLVSGIAAGVGAPVLLLVSDRLLGGQLGFGDVKLAVSLGLIFGVSAFFYGMVVAGIGFSVVLVALIVARRLSLKSVVPFGPVLIFAGFLAAFLG